MSGMRDPLAKAEIEWLIGMISAVRSYRAMLNVPAKDLLPYKVSGASDEIKGRLATYAAQLERMAGICPAAQETAGASVNLDWHGSAYQIFVGESLNVPAAVKRLNAALNETLWKMDQLTARLASRAFVTGAKEEVVGRARDDHRALTAKARRLHEILTDLGAA